MMSGASEQPPGIVGGSLLRTFCPSGGPDIPPLDLDVHDMQFRLGRAAEA